MVVSYQLEAAATSLGICLVPLGCIIPMARGLRGKEDAQR